MSDRTENPLEFWIRPLEREQYEDKKGKYDGKNRDYFNWNKMVRAKIRKEGYGDIMEKNFFEEPKPTNDIRKVKKHADGTQKYDIEIINQANKNIKRWREQADKIKTAGLAALGILEGTLTAEAWRKTENIQEQEGITERERLNCTLEYFEKQNNKYSAKSVEEVQEKFRIMGMCKTRRDVEMMVQQVDILQMALEKIPASFIMRAGHKEIQEHKKTDIQMNEHILKRLPAKPMWDQLKAEAVRREGDASAGAFTTAELGERIAQMIEQYTLTHVEETQEKKDNEESDKEPQKRRRTVQAESRTEAKQSKVNSVTTASASKDTKEARQQKCIHFEHNNCRRGDTCPFIHDKKTTYAKRREEGDRYSSSNSDRGGSFKGKKDMKPKVNTTAIIKRKKRDSSDEEEENAEEEERRIVIYRRKEETAKERREADKERKIRKLEKELKELRQHMETEDEDDEALMTESD